MILDESLFETKREPSLYNKVYDGLDKLGYKVFASTDVDGLEISKKFEKNLQKAKDWLDRNNIKYKVKKFLNRFYLQVPTQLTEDIEKTKSGKWVNKGKEGTHGEFKTKKAADAQRKAMFARGFKGESLESEEEPERLLDRYARETERIIKLAQNASPSVKKKLVKEFNSWHDREDDKFAFYSLLFLDEGADNFWKLDTIIRNHIIDTLETVYKYNESVIENLGSDMAEYQKWVDYDMKKYGSISDDTNEKIRKAGLKIVKDKYGDYEVIANEPIKEDLSEPTIEEMFKYLKEYPQYNHQYIRPVKYYDLDLTSEQEDEFFNFLQDEADGLGNFWEENAALSQNIYQEGTLGGHLVLDATILEPKIFDDIESVDEMIQDELEYNYYPNNEDGTYDERQKQEAKEDVEKEIKDSYITLKDFDERVDELIANLKATLDARIKNKDLGEDLSMASKTPNNSKINFDIKDNGDFTFSVNGKEYKGHTDKPEEMSKDMKEFGFNLSEQCSIKEDIIKSIEPLDIDVNREVESTFASDDKSFPYRMLSRLQNDCKYVLGALKDSSKDGKLDLETINKFLWFNDIDKQIAFMKGIYERLDEKPEWITLEEIEDYRNQMKALIRTESIKENLDPEHSEDGPKQEDTGIAQMLIDAINGEWDTIKLYNDILVNAESYGNSDIADVIRDIVAEENTHIGQLQKALEIISPNVSKIEDGAKEAESQLTNETEIKDLQNYELGE